MNVLNTVDSSRIKKNLQAFEILFESYFWLERYMWYILNRKKTPQIFLLPFIVNQSLSDVRTSGHKASDGSGYAVAFQDAGYDFRSRYGAQRGRRWSFPDYSIAAYHSYRAVPAIYLNKTKKTNTSYLRSETTSTLCL